MPYSNKPQPLSTVLGELIDRLGYREHIDAARAVDLWPELAGETIAGVTEKVWMSHGRLFVKVRSAAWRHQLHLQREGWRNRLNDRLGREVVDEIIFR